MVSVKRYNVEYFGQGLSNQFLLMFLKLKFVFVCLIFLFLFWVHNMQGQNMIFAYKHKRLTVILNQSLSFMTSFTKKLTPVHKSLGKVCYSLLLESSFWTVFIILMMSINVNSERGFNLKAPYKITWMIVDGHSFWSFCG